MSSYRAGADLLKMVGARVVSMDVNGKAENFICIPARFNDITINADNEGRPKSAFLNFNLWATNENFRKACLARNAEKENYQAPSHELSVSYSEDFQAAACRSAEKRLRANAEFMAKNPSEEDIKKQARWDVSNRSRFGFATPIQPKAAPTYQKTAPAAPAMGGYQAPSTDQPVAPEDDLPF